MLELVSKGVLTIERVAELMCHRPAMLFDVVFLDPDMAGQQIELIRQLYGGSLDSDTLELIGKEGFYPKVMFFSNLTYGFVYGAILSWILSRYIPKRDPFSSYMDKNGK